MPVGVVDPALDEPTEEWRSYTPKDWYPTKEGSKRIRGDSHNHASCEWSRLSSCWSRADRLLAPFADTSAEDWAGLPINIQVFALPHQEEKVLAIADVIDRLVKGV